MPSTIILRMDERIMPSSCSSHFSTCPLASDVEMTVSSSTSSFSLERMWVMSRSSVKVRRAMPSKHFFKCGCTRVGSFVSERISSISSLDKKKNREKYRRFCSR